MSWVDFIAQDINMSISNKNKHFTVDEIIATFNKNYENLNKDDLYILKTIFTESYLEAFYNFLKETHINFNQAKIMYSFLKTKGIKNEKFDWFFRI